MKYQKAVKLIDKLREDRTIWEVEKKELFRKLSRVECERGKLAEEAQALLELTFVSYARQAHERPGRDKKSNSMKGKCLRLWGVRKRTMLI